MQVFRDVGQRGRAPAVLSPLEERVRELELRLREQSRLADMGLKVAGLAHNLCSPLQGIINTVEMLQLMHGDLPHLDEILEQAVRLSDMLTNMLCKSRQEQDQNVQDFDLNRLLIQELDFLSADPAFKHEIEKDYNFDPALPAVRGVYLDFSQALVNIVNNAIDAMYGRDRKLLTVRTAAQNDGGILVEIGDTGLGIPPDCRHRIFDPFFTTKPLAGRQQGYEPTGTGLGLSSARQLLEKYDVRFEVLSEVGEGTTFRIFLPAKVLAQEKGSDLSQFELKEELI